MIPASTPTAKRVRTFACPVCHALAGRGCETDLGWPRARHHIERVAVAQRWLGKQLPLFAEHS